MECEGYWKGRGLQASEKVQYRPVFRHQGQLLTPEAHEWEYIIYSVAAGMLCLYLRTSLPAIGIDGFSLGGVWVLVGPGGPGVCKASGESSGGKVKVRVIVRLYTKKGQGVRLR